MNENWIRVKDRLPDGYTAVLGVNANGITADDREPEKAHLEDGKWYLLNPLNYSEFIEIIVTHWMPLPDPPKEAK